MSCFTQYKLKDGRRIRGRYDSIGTAFHCYSTLFDYDTAYDLSDGIVVEEKEDEE